MQKLFNMMSGYKNQDNSPDSYSKWVKEQVVKQESFRTNWEKEKELLRKLTEDREKVMQLEKQLNEQAKKDYENIKERLSCLEEAVFGNGEDTST